MGQAWSNVSGNNQKQILFSGNPGLKINIPSVSIWDYFHLFITDKLIDLMVLETNCNADQMLTNQRVTKSSRFSKWTPTNSKEIKLFLGLLIWRVTAV